MQVNSFVSSCLTYFSLCYPLGSNTLLNIVGFHLLQDVTVLFSLFCKFRNVVFHIFSDCENMSHFLLKIYSLIMVFIKELYYFLLISSLFFAIISLVSAPIFFIAVVQQCQAGPAKNRGVLLGPFLISHIKTLKIPQEFLSIDFRSAPAPTLFPGITMM